MRIGIVSDVHSNLQALLAVKEKMDGAGLDLVVSAGDVVGYGADPNKCCEIVAGWTGRAVIGNHDIAALKKSAEAMNPYAAKAALWTARQLSESSSAYLSSLRESVKYSAEGGTLEMHHGSPRSVWEYIYEEDLSEGMLEEAGADVLVLGHTHVPYVRRFRGGLIINPGSVGQPRDGDPRASSAILETSNLTCRIIRTEYDIEEASARILGAGLPEMLATRLYRGF